MHNNGPRHKQARAYNPPMDWAYVDEQLVELLELLWRGGVTTLFSCQGDDFFKDETLISNRPNLGYIMMVRSPESLALCVNLLRFFPPLCQVGKKVLWEIEFDRHVPRDAYWGKEGRITIRFPNSDIPKLVDFVKNDPRLG